MGRDNPTSCVHSITANGAGIMPVWMHPGCNVMRTVLVDDAGPSDEKIVDSLDALEVLAWHGVQHIADRI